MVKKKTEDVEYIRRVVSKFENKIGKKVLIFGASNRDLVEELIARDKKVTLLDIRESAFDKFYGLKITKKLVKKDQEFEGVSNQNTIFFFDTLHHVHDKRQKISECFNILEEGGTVILYEPNIFTKVMREYDQFGELKESIYKLSLIKLLKKNGFEVDLHSPEELHSRKRQLKNLIIALQKSAVDPIFRILLIATKLISKPPQKV